MLHTLRRVPAIALFTLAALAVTLMFAAEANAATYTGDTSQGRAAKLRDSDATGVPTKFAISWQTKKCNRPTTTYTDRTVFNGFRTATRQNFASRGSYRFNDGQFSGRVRVRVSGQRKSQAAWRGGFRARVRVFRNGNQYDRCRLRPIGWNVRRGAMLQDAPASSASRSYSG